MKIDLSPGTYVLAISGGVDSMVLLDLLAGQNNQPGFNFIVAHFDHGIRPDSNIDRKIVQQVAQKHGLMFVYQNGNLSSDASEELARRARYEFLRAVRRSAAARAIITAHHQDDLLETAIHNMIRGTGRAGVVALRSRGDLLRPLLDVTKKDLINYAQKKQLVWREDSTNSDLRFKRNLIRHKLMPKLSDEQRRDLIGHIKNLNNIHSQLEKELVNHLHLHPSSQELDRHWFIMLPHAVSRELMMIWLRHYGVKNLTSRKLEKIVNFCKTAQIGSSLDVSKQLVIRIGKKSLQIKRQVA